MDSWVLFEFAFKCFSFVAWPCIALGYPLCASIRAIETNSDYHTKKLVTYWILFSLISLFEHAFMNQLQRIPIWSSTKLLIVCWLAIPRFNGSVSVYKLFVRPCLSVAPKDAINWFLRQTNSLRKRDDFLDKVDKYINDNGTEALEKLLANKTTKSHLVPENNNAAEEDNDVIKYQQNDVLPEDAKVLKMTEKIEAAEANQINAYTRKEMLKINETTAAVKSCEDDPFCIVPEGSKLAGFEDGVLKMKKSCLVPEESKAAVEDSDVMHVNGYAEKGVFEPKEIKESTNRAAMETCRGDPPPIMPPTSKPVQREWTCAICQVTTTSEITLNFHLKGKRHEVALEKLKEKLKVTRRASNAKVLSSDEKPKPKPNVVTNNKRSVEERKWRCSICDVNCTGDYDLSCHVRGKKHLSNLMST